MRTLFTVLVVLIIFGLAYYFFVVKDNKPSIKDGDPCIDVNGNSGTYINGSCVANTTSNNGTPNNPPVNPSEGSGTTLGYGSVKINASEVREGKLNLGSLNLSNLIVNNVLSVSSNPLAFVHYETGNTQGGCPSSIWWRNSFYVVVGSNINSQGIKTCYYKFDRSAFPSSIKINPELGSCNTQGYYISGVKYNFSGKQAIPQTLPVKYNCIYTKA